MKKFESVIRTYLSGLSFDELRFLAIRFTDRIGSDIAEVTEFLSKSPEMDRFLLTARNAEEFYDMLDLIHTYVEKEFYRRTPEVVEA